MRAIVLLSLFATAVLVSAQSWKDNLANPGMFSFQKEFDIAAIGAVSEFVQLKVATEKQIFDRRDAIEAFRIFNHLDGTEDFISFNRKHCLSGGIK